MILNMFISGFRILLVQLFRLWKSSFKLASIYLSVHSSIIWPITDANKNLIFLLRCSFMVHLKFRSIHLFGQGAQSRETLIVTCGAESLIMFPQGTERLASIYLPVKYHLSENGSINTIQTTICLLT